MGASAPVYTVGVDIGGTNMSAAVVDSSSGRLISQATIETLARQGPEDGMQRLADLIRSVLTQAQVAPEALIGIGVGCTGPVDTERGLIQNPFTLPTWDDLPIVDILTAQFHRSTLLLNDAHVAALAEHRVGAGRGTANMVYITVSTGIGGGLILNGRLHRGQGLTAGEIGHQSLNFEGRLCYCGAHGCWEMYAAGPAIARMTQERVTPASLIWQLAHGHPEDISAKLVGEAAQQGDALALEIFRETGMYLGVGIANLITILAPDMLVLGGGVMQSHAFILPSILDTLSKQKFLVAAEGVQIAVAQLGLNAGVIGAAYGIIGSLNHTL